MTPEKLLEALTDIDEGAIEAARQAMPRKRARRAGAVLVAAAMLALAVSACAAVSGSEWFLDFFARRSQAELEQGQSAYIEANTQNIGKSLTRDGYTLTLESAFTDGTHAFINATLTAPKGVVLGADSYSAEILDFPTNEDGDAFSGGAGWEYTEDGDRTDNVAGMLFTMDVSAWCWDRISLAEKHTWTVTFGDLTANWRENWDTEQARVRRETVCEGPWKFTFTFSAVDDREIELVSEPVTCVTTNSPFAYGEYIDAQITSFRLRAMSARVQFRFAEFEERNGDFGNIYVVMKDGSRVLLERSSGGPNMNGYTFDAPIVLEDVDHVLLPNGVELAVP